MFDLLVREGRVVGEDGVKEQSIAIAGGRVDALFADGELPPARETIDAKAKLVLLGLVDSHVHFPRSRADPQGGWRISRPARWPRLLAV